MFAYSSRQYGQMSAAELALKEKLLLDRLGEVSTLVPHELDELEDVVMPIVQGIHILFSARLMKVTERGGPSRGMSQLARYFGVVSFIPGEKPARAEDKEAVLAEIETYRNEQLGKARKATAEGDDYWAGIKLKVANAALYLQHMVRAHDVQIERQVVEDPSIPQGQSDSYDAFDALMDSLPKFDAATEKVLEGVRLAEEPQRAKLMAVAVKLQVVYRRVCWFVSPLEDMMLARAYSTDGYDILKLSYRPLRA